MTFFRIEHSDPSTCLPLGLRAARWLWIVVLSGCLSASGLVAGHYVLRSGAREQAAGRWMKTLDLTMPALHPSGSPLRFPESALPAVDLRLMPGDMDLDGYDIVITPRLKRGIGKDGP
jgi:hypothetical protein